MVGGGGGGGGEEGSVHIAKANVFAIMLQLIALVK